MQTTAHRHEAAVGRVLDSRRQRRADEPYGMAHSKPKRAPEPRRHSDNVTIAMDAGPILSVSRRAPYLAPSRNI
eukprot:scaffold359802_cov17-Prasinocladus_malaysianus.AAC.1